MKYQPLGLCAQGAVKRFPGKALRLLHFELKVPCAEQAFSLAYDATNLRDLRVAWSEWLVPVAKLRHWGKDRVQYMIAIWKGKEELQRSQPKVKNICPMTALLGIVRGLPERFSQFRYFTNSAPHNMSSVDNTSRAPQG